MSARSEVVITGAGLVCALGATREGCWDAVERGICGIRPLTALEQEATPIALGGEAPRNSGGGDEAPREVVRLRSALAEALADARLTDTSYTPDRCGIVLGTTLAGMRSAGVFLRTDDPGAMRPFLAASTVQQMMADRAWTGMAITTCSACGSGLASLCLGVSLLRAGALDLVITGGYDTISEYAYAGFNSLRLITDGPPRPFSRDRRGMQLGESYAIITLERAADAAARGAAPLARFAGYGETSDAHHLTQPHPEGDGAARAMQAALDEAGIEPGRIGLISAHATATPNNDVAERAALRRVFGPTLPDVPVVAFKSYLGHTLGGAGAAELVLTSMAMRAGRVPRTLHLRAGEIEFDDLAINLGPPRSAVIDHTLGLSLGFGGANSCVILAAPDVVPARDSGAMTTAGEVVVTGIGVVLPGAIGNAAFAQRITDGAPMVGGEIADGDLLALIDARRTRRMSTFVKLVLAATALALKDAAVDDVGAFTETCGAILGSAHGSTAYTEQYYGQIVAEGIGAANPMLFAEGVPNVGTAQLSLMLGLRGPAQTIIGSRTAGLDALHLAALRIRNGEWSRAIVGAAEECTATVDRLYRHCGWRGTTGAGAVILVLEAAEMAARRTARVRGTVDAGVLACVQTGADETAVLARVRDRLGAPARVITCAVDGADHGADVVSSIAGHVAETYSVMPLAAIAAGLLTGRLPAHLQPARVRGAAHPALGSEPADSFAVVVRDMFGPICGVALSASGQTVG